MKLVVGATGMVGSEVCRLLVAAGQSVRALVRATSDPVQVTRLERLGLEVVRGDLKDRRSLDQACKGIDTVLSTASATLSRQPGDSLDAVDRIGQLDLIAAARAAGVSRALYVSFPPVDVDFPLQSAKRAVEEQLTGSGMSYTILQPTFFMEVWLSPALGFDAANAKARICGSGTQKISWISYKDVARFAVLSLEQPAVRNATLRLGGPDALNPLEVVQIFERVRGRKFTVEFVPEAALHAQRSATSDPLQQSFAGLMLYYAQGDVIDMHATLRTLPVKMISVAEFAQGTA